MGDKITKWETQSTESKKRILGGSKTVNVSSRMEYDKKNGKAYGKPIKKAEAVTTIKTNRKGDVVREKKIITPNSGPTTVVKTNRSGKEKIKTKNDRDIKYDTKGEPKVRRRHMKP